MGHTMKTAKEGWPANSITVLLVPWLLLTGLIGYFAPGVAASYCLAIAAILGSISARCVSDSLLGPPGGRWLQQALRSILDLMAAAFLIVIAALAWEPLRIAWGGAYAEAGLRVSASLGLCASAVVCAAGVRVLVNDVQALRPGAKHAAMLAVSATTSAVGAVGIITSMALIVIGRLPNEFIESALFTVIGFPAALNLGTRMLEPFARRYLPVHYLSE